MKTKLLFQSLCTFLMVFVFQFSFAFDGGSVMGRVADPDTKTPVGGATVVFESLGSQTSYTTNDSGYYYASNLPAGIYTVTAGFMSHRSSVTQVKIGTGAQMEVNVDLSTGSTIGDIIVSTTRRYNPPLIDPFRISTGKLERSEFTKEPITKIADITAQQPGITDINGVFYVKGAREGSLAYYVDGGPAMNGGNNIPLCGLDTYEIYTGFIPPKYGDTEGGVVVLETRNYFTASH